MNAKDLKIGMLVRVVPHTIYSDLVVDASVTPMRKHRHTGYRRLGVVTGIDSDGLGGTIVEVKIGHSFDYVAPEHIEIAPRRTAARFYVQVRRQSDNGKFYGPFYAKSKAIKFANEHEVASDDLEAKRETTIYTHTQMVKKFGCGFENYPWKYLEA